MRLIFRRRSQTSQKRTKRHSRKLKAACLTLGLATAWGAEAEADVTFRITVKPTQTLTNALVLFGTNVSSGALVSLGPLSGNETNVFEQTFKMVDHQYGDTWIADPAAYDSANGPAYYSLVATYENGAGATVSFPNSDPVANSMSWDSLFNDPAYVSDFYPAYAEQDVIDDLRSGSYPSYARDFLVRFNGSDGEGSAGFHLAGTEYGIESTLINFSDASYAGTVIVEVVPEPASWVLLIGGAGISAMALRRR